MTRTGEATLVKNAGSHYLLSELPVWELFPAVLRGRIRLKDSEVTNPISVGDRVRFEMDGEATPEKPAVITEILPRRNYIIRKSVNLSHPAHIIAANLDKAYIIVTLQFPEIKLPFLDRILVTCEAYGIPVAIVLNKMDLMQEVCPEQVADFHRIYESAGYRIIEVSARTGYGIDALRQDTVGKICLFSGESGVGKSSVIKSLDKTLDPKIGRISEAHLQGKHTTSLYEMYKVNDGGFIIDTPGLRGFGLIDLKKEEIALYFPEMLRISENCRFSPCTHTHEPGCAVKDAVGKGIISAERYSSYLGMLDEDRKYR
ncbi:MAG: ribosome small subunit-dependent GTPase A [Bacteroidales bacterium]|jgi:ribosome biogenesis GTPase|nr:ribosome small subunit-dependent GTPase A [Bacteroidales bacterium]MCI1784645.1 ribosome small subunit-dependent GTPase A [Bacteroidales bacterium]